MTDIHYPTAPEDDFDPLTEDEAEAAYRDAELYDHLLAD